jgi:heme-degrading monooxygenase HmoA
MYARMNTAHWNPETREKATQLTWDTIIPGYENQPGYRGYLLLLEPNGDKGIAITLWDTEADMEASVAVAKAMTAELRDVLLERPVTENYEVIAHFPEQP